MYYRIDRKGYILNQASTRKIQHQYREAVRAALSYSRDRLGKDLLSVYVRGSIPLGKGTLDYSDIDIVLVTRGWLSRRKLSWIAGASRELKERFPRVDLFDLSIVSAGELLHDPRYKMLRFHVKTNAAR